MNTTPPRPRPHLRTLMTELACRLLRYAGAVTERVECRMPTDAGTAVIVLLPPGDADAPESGHAGLFMSAEELRLVEKLADLKARRPAEKVSGPQLCKLAGVPYENPGRYLLRNLVNRQVLTLDETEGYGVAGGTP